MEEIQNYQKNSVGTYILFAVMTLIGLAALVGMFFMENKIAAAIIGIIIGGGGGVSLLSTVKEDTKLRQELEALQSTGAMPQLIAEFQSARQMMNDKIRLGNQHIFRKHGGILLKYSDVVQVYQTIRRKNFAETSRTLNAVLKDKKTIVLCDLKVRGKSDEEMKEIIVHMCLRNPAILVGFKNPSRLNLGPIAQNPAPVPAAKFCPGCGKRLAQSEKFCPDCGRQV